MNLKDLAAANDLARLLEDAEARLSALRDAKFLEATFKTTKDQIMPTCFTGQDYQAPSEIGDAFRAIRTVAINYQVERVEEIKKQLHAINVTV